MHGGVRSCSSEGGGRLSSFGEMDPAVGGGDLGRIFSCRARIAGLVGCNNNNSREVDGRGWGKVVSGD